MGWTNEHAEKVKVVVNGEEIMGHELARTACLRSSQTLLEEDMPAVALALEILERHSGCTLRELAGGIRMAGAIVDILSRRETDKHLSQATIKPGTSSISLPGITL